MAGEGRLRPRMHQKHITASRDCYLGVSSHLQIRSGYARLTQTIRAQTAPRSWTVATEDDAAKYPSLDPMTGVAL
jgi:hypothetical protein